MRPRADADRILAFARELPYSQVLAKLERSFDQDLEDVRAMIDRRLIEPQHALSLFTAIEPELYRFPAIDPASFRSRVERALGP